MEEGRIVIVCYKPFAGREDDLDLLMKEHAAILRNEGLVTDRESILMRADNGTVVEVFEWKSKVALAGAHTNPVVQKMWADYSKVCEYVPIGSLPEATELFSSFTPFGIR